LLGAQFSSILSIYINLFPFVYNLSIYLVSKKLRFIKVSLQYLLIIGFAGLSPIFTNFCLKGFIILSVQFKIDLEFLSFLAVVYNKCHWHFHQLLANIFD